MERRATNGAHVDVFNRNFLHFLSSGATRNHLPKMGGREQHVPGVEVSGFRNG